MGILSYSVALVYLLPLSPVLHCRDYYGFIGRLAVRYARALTVPLLQCCVIYSGSFASLYTFYNQFSVPTNSLLEF